MYIQKVMAIILRENPPAVLVHDMHVPGYTSLRMPGGGVDPGETAEEATLRELKEEAGIEDAEIIRFVGTLTYRSAVTANLQERHCYLIRPATALPDTWTHTVTGDGEDADYPFSHFWITVDEIDRVDEKLRPILSPESLPELHVTNTTI